MKTAGEDEKAVRSRVIQHYDALAPQYERFYEGRTRLAHFYLTRRMRTLELLEGLAPGSMVLGLGCGPAPMAERILKMGLRYIGVDISTGMIGLCQQRYAHEDAAQFLVADGLQLPLASAAFDAVTCLGMVEYVLREESVIAEMARVLRPGGTCILSGINPWSPYNLWDRLVYRRITGRRPAAIVHEYHTEQQCRRMLAEAGLEVRDALYFDFNLLPPPLDKRLARLGVACSEYLESSSRGGLRKLANGFLVSATKTA